MFELWTGCPNLGHSTLVLPFTRIYHVWEIREIPLVAPFCEKLEDFLLRQQKSGFWIFINSISDRALFPIIQLKGGTRKQYWDTLSGHKDRNKAIKTSRAREGGWLSFMSFMLFTFSQSLIPPQHPQNPCGHFLAFFHQPPPF